ncbi:late histone H2A.2.2-like [Cyrtonyx montezumae]|uniref:late histone H2A.2.2-like n=1 Tax=Cyrtonyx montezumae TaxID=9017 RepID=UPI0032DB808A
MESPMEASSMLGTDEVCTVLEQEREPEAVCSEEPSMAQEVKAKKSRRGMFARRFGASVPVYLAAVLQWVTCKTTDMAAKISKKRKQLLISPSHLKVSVKKSAVFKRLLGSGPKHRGKSVPQSQPVASPSKRRPRQ